MGDKLFAVITGIFLIFAIPYVTTCIVQGKNNERINDLKSVDSGRHICISDNGEYKLIDAEEYIVYALAGKVDMAWDDEMLQTMAVIFRTSIYYQMENQMTKKADKNIINEEDLYEIRYSDHELRDMWKNRYSMNLERLYNAVLTTCGQVIRYQEEIIMPVYHRVSIGHTISAQELYDVEIPYLQNVDSSVDIEAENFSGTYIYSEGRLKKEFKQLNENDLYEMNPDSDENKEEQAHTEYSSDELKVIEATKSGFAKRINVFGNVVDGKTFAKILQLPSTNIHIDIVDKGYRVITIGEGNSLGLSLYGAEKLAENGMNYKEILEYYYYDIEITGGK